MYLPLSARLTELPPGQDLKYGELSVVAGLQSGSFRRFADACKKLCVAEPLSKELCVEKLCALHTSCLHMVSLTGML